MSGRQLIAELLSALEYHTEQTRPIEFSKGAIEAAREYLNKPAQQEPVACVAQYVLDYISNGHKDVHTFVWNPKKKPTIPLVDLYTSPPASKPLTPLLFSRRKAIADKLGVPMDSAFSAIVREVEAAHDITIEAAHQIKGGA